MQIKKIISSPLQNNTWILSTEKKALVIDPTIESFKNIIHFLKDNDLKLEAILITHSHFDHISGVAKLQKESHSKVYVHKLDAENLIVPGSDGIPLFEKIEPAIPDAYIEDESKIHLDSLEITVIHTPGHTLGSVCYYLKKEKILFSGDTLFYGTCGRVDLTNSDKELMWSSLKKLSNLPKETKVYPGHGRETTIGKETWLENAKELFE